MCALIRPTTRSPRRARNSSASPFSHHLLKRGFRKSRRSSRSGGIHIGSLACSRNGSSMNSFRSRRERTGVTSTDTRAHPSRKGLQMAIQTDLFEKARKHERLEQLQAARELDYLPYFREVEA